MSSHMAMLSPFRYTSLSWVSFRRLPVGLFVRSLSSDSNDEGKNVKVTAASLLSSLKNETPDFDVESIKEEKNNTSKVPLQRSFLFEEDTKDKVVKSEYTADRVQPEFGDDFEASPPDFKVSADRRFAREYSSKVGVKESTSQARKTTARKTKRQNAPKLPKAMEDDTKSQGVSGYGNLLRSLKDSKGDSDSGRQDLRSVLGEWTKESENKLGKLIPVKRKTPEAMSKSEMPSQPVFEKNLKDLEEDLASFGPLKPKVDTALDKKLKGLLSELKVESKNMTAAKSIVDAAENWGKSPSNQRIDIMKEYNSQTNEWQPGPTRSKMEFSFQSSDRAGLFDAIFNKEKTATLEQGSLSPFLMQVKAIDEVNDLQNAGVKNNAFGRQINLSDKLWQYPIDNEACKVEEKDVGFEEHVFLEYLLDGFPSKGPVRRFMELVINGLQQNPHLTVKEKRDRVDWFHDYFSEFTEEDLNF